MTRRSLLRIGLVVSLAAAAFVVLLLRPSTHNPPAQGKARLPTLGAGPRPAFAVDCFVYRLVREVGALVAVLGGLDGLVFTGGIGEHAAEIRDRVCRAFAWLGLVLDPDANERHAPCITMAIPS